MKEDFLHYLWKYQLYYPEKLSDPTGHTIHVIRPGEYNRDSGPDFFNALISIDGTIWAGNVELHTKASHFDLHDHQNDPAFDNIILHVVAENDKKIFNSKGEEILTVEVLYDPLLYERYLDLVNNPYAIACQTEAGLSDPSLLDHWLTYLVIERLSGKKELISRIFSETGNDWEETFYRILVRYFGFRINTEPFEMLATAIPFKILRKHADNLFQTEALLFGTAGLLDEGLFRDALHDEYYVALISEYKILSAKYSLKPIHGWLWKFSRLRPANFPTVRISQLASLLSVSGGLFSHIIEATSLKQLQKLFEISASSYWNDHFVFGKISRVHKKQTGEQATRIFLINAVVPVIFYYGTIRDLPLIKARAINFLKELAPEENIILTVWEEAGIIAHSAFDSQALIQLRNEYCKKRRCLECRIGSSMVSRGVNLKNQDELLLEP